MNKTEVLEQVRITCRVRRLSYHTEQCYSGWIARFIGFMMRAHIKGLAREERLAKYLEELAPRSSASTQNQALNSVVFLYRDVLKQHLGDIGKWARAKRPKRLPVYLEKAEMKALWNGEDFVEHCRKQVLWYNDFAPDYEFPRARFGKLRFPSW